MTITVRYWRRRSNFEPDCKARIEKKFCGNTAAECMKRLEDYKNYHDLAEYTEPEIINVED